MYRKLEEHVFKRGADVKKFDLRRVLLETIEERREFLDSYPVATSLKNVSKQKVHDAYIDKIHSEIENRFKGDSLSNEEVASLVNNVIEALFRAIQSDFAAGIIVAGYGSDEMFPSLCSVEIDGRIAGQLKITESSHKTIKDATDKGQVVYFAQTDVIERLLKGVDPEFVEKTTEFIHRAVMQVADTIETALRRKKSRKKRENRVKI